MTLPTAHPPTNTDTAECGTLVSAEDHAPSTDAEHEEAQRRAMEAARELLPHDPEGARAILEAALVRPPRKLGTK